MTTTNETCGNVWVSEKDLKCWLDPAQARYDELIDDISEAKTALRQAQLKYADIVGLRYWTYAHYDRINHPSIFSDARTLLPAVAAADDKRILMPAELAARYSKAAPSVVDDWLFRLREAAANFDRRSEMAVASKERMREMESEPLPAFAFATPEQTKEVRETDWIVIGTLIFIVSMIMFFIFK